MFVGRRMTRNVVVVSAGDTLKLAARLMKERRIHHLPVLEGDELAGIVTDSDIRNAALGEGAGGGAMERLVGEIMTRDPVTVGPWDTVEDALLILHQRRFGALPVVEGHRLVGIISKADILTTLIGTLSIEGKGVRLEVLVPRGPGAVVRLAQALEGLGVELKSLILSPFREDYVAFVRLETIDVTTVREKLRKAGFRIPDLSAFLEYGRSRRPWPAAALDCRRKKRKGPVSGALSVGALGTPPSGSRRSYEAPLKTGLLEKKQRTSPSAHATVIAYMAFVNAPVVDLM